MHIKIIKQKTNKEFQIMSNEKRFNIDIRQDGNGLVDISISNSQDINSNMEYDDLVKRLEDVFHPKSKK